MTTFCECVAGPHRRSRAAASNGVLAVATWGCAVKVTELNVVPVDVPRVAFAALAVLTVHRGASCLRFTVNGFWQSNHLLG